jgi:hypothetical protein
MCEHIFSLYSATFIICVGPAANADVSSFRLPVGWQYLVGSTSDSSSTSLDASFFATYDALVKGVTDAGAYAIIDIHNYARWNGAIIGQGGPSNDDVSYARTTCVELT